MDVCVQRFELFKPGQGPLLTILLLLQKCRAERRHGFVKTKSNVYQRPSPAIMMDTLMTVLTQNRNRKNTQKNKKAKTKNRPCESIKAPQSIGVRTTVKQDAQVLHIIIRVLSTCCAVRTLPTARILRFPRDVQVYRQEGEKVKLDSKCEFIFGEFVYLLARFSL